MALQRRFALLVGLLVLPALDHAALGDSRVGPESYQAKVLRVAGIVGTLRVEVMPEGGPLEVTLAGQENLLDDIKVSTAGDTLVIERKKSLFDWKPDERQKWLMNFPTITVRIPRGTPLEIVGMQGRATVGDLAAPLRLDTAVLDADIGQVSEAWVKLNGRGDVTLGDVAGHLAVTIGASGKFTAGAAASADVSISGSGDVRLGALRRLNCTVSGSGNIDAAAVDGPLEVRMNGSGDVRINGGRATSLRLRSGGSGDFRLDGEAAEPDLAIAGTGTVWIKSYSGWVRFSDYTGQLRSSPGGELELRR